MAHCHSCGAPLDENMKGVSEVYCRHCADGQGKLLPRAQVQAGVSGWLKSWQPGLTEDQADERAAHYMSAMPAWAED